MSTGAIVVRAILGTCEKSAADIKTTICLSASHYADSHYFISARLIMSRIAKRKAEGIRCWEEFFKF